MARSRITLDGLPHSEISGSKPVCGSPELIAAYHVLHRRPVPRHPPYALSSLTTTFTLLAVVGINAYASLLLQDLRLSMSPGLVTRGRFDATEEPSVTEGSSLTSATRLASLKRRASPGGAGMGGGAGRDRTDDLRLAKAALYQMS